MKKALLIALEVAPSIVRRSIAIGVGDVPGFSVQSVQTTARVQAGESLVLGGLLSFDEGLEERGIPGLRWIPATARAPPRSRASRAGGTSSPAGAKMIDESSFHGGSSSASPRASRSTV